MMNDKPVSYHITKGPMLTISHQWYAIIQIIEFYDFLDHTFLTVFIRKRMHFLSQSYASNKSTIFFVFFEQKYNFSNFLNMNGEGMWRIKEKEISLLWNKNNRLMNLQEIPPSLCRLWLNYGNFVGNSLDFLFHFTTLTGAIAGVSYFLRSNGNMTHTDKFIWQINHQRLRKICFLLFAFAIFCENVDEFLHQSSRKSEKLKATASVCGKCFPCGVLV
jgi:hypothetical protein